MQIKPRSNEESQPGLSGRGVFMGVFGKNRLDHSFTPLASRILVSCATAAKKLHGRVDSAPDNGWALGHEMRKLRVFKPSMARRSTSRDTAFWGGTLTKPQVSETMLP